MQDFDFAVIARSLPFLADGDTVVLRGWCGEGDDRIDLGHVVGTVIP